MSSNSKVWEFFSKIDSRTAKCNLCSKTLKSSGNTSNLAAHLKSKHGYAYAKVLMPGKLKTPIPAIPEKKRPRTEEEQVDDPTTGEEDTCEENVNVSGSSDSDISFTRPPPKQQTISDCMTRLASFSDGGPSHEKLMQGLVYMICKDNLPLSCVEKEGMKHFCGLAVPRFKLPSRFTVTRKVELRYASLKAIVKKELEEVENVSMTSDILTLTNSTRSFLVMTVHFLDRAHGMLESISLSATRLDESHTADYIAEKMEEITAEFGIEKNKILAMTTDNGANIKAAVPLFLGENKRIPCTAHIINLIVNGALSGVPEVSGSTNQVKGIVTYFKHSVNAMDALRAEQERSGKKEGQVKVLIQAVSTRWNSVLDMIERFLELSGPVAKILSSTSHNVPDMVPSSKMKVLSELVQLLKPFKQATEETSGEKYVTSSLVVPLASLLVNELEAAAPSTSIGKSVATQLLREVKERLLCSERTNLLSKATILDPRFKKLHFLQPTAAAEALTQISAEIKSEHKRRGQLSPELLQAPSTSTSAAKSIWDRHESLVRISSTTSQIANSAVPSDFKQYLDQPVLPRSANPLKFWNDAQYFTPVLAQVALKYLLPSASSVSSERVASAVNIVVPDSRSRLTGEHIKERVFLTSLSEKYWSM